MQSLVAWFTYEWGFKFRETKREKKVAKACKDVTKEGSLAWNQGCFQMEAYFFEVWLICFNCLWWWIQTGLGIIFDKGKDEPKSNATLNPKPSKPIGKNIHQNNDH